MEDSSTRRVVCPENEALSAFLLEKKMELAESPKGLSENVENLLSRVYDSICFSEVAITSLKDLSQIRGVGKWTVKLLNGYFHPISGRSEPGEITRKDGNAKGNKRYVPQRNSVAYALLITLYRITTNGGGFMKKQELIDAAEASGLSRVPIAPERGKGKLSSLESGPKNWYSGWNCMKTLITKGLVVKSSCPAKYMLTEEGVEAARECLIRSHLHDPLMNLNDEEHFSDVVLQDKPNIGCVHSPTRQDTSRESDDTPVEFVQTGDFCHRGEDQSSLSEGQDTQINNHLPVLRPCRSRKDIAGNQSYNLNTNFRAEESLTDQASASNRISAPMRSCSSTKQGVMSDFGDSVVAFNVLSWPPLSLGEKFVDVYDIVLIMDDREQINGRRGNGAKLIENICKEYKIKIEFRHLPVGDCIWIVRHKYSDEEYVLDFIIERKNIDDLRLSIRDNRYKNQKVKLLRCGLKKLIYLVEGDPNTSESAASIKTACFTTEILEGFNVQRTSSLIDTLRTYAHLTLSIHKYYAVDHPDGPSTCNKVCSSYNEFVSRCKDIEKVTVSDVFAVQLMQVPQVTEEVALAVVELYPTVISLAQAYSLLDGDSRAQEEMLRKQSNNLISLSASKNIFHLVWGNDQ